MATKRRNAKLARSAEKSKEMVKKLGARTYEIKAVGAWVQPEPADSGHHVYAAVIAAQVEEEKILRQQQNKQEQLKRFQEDVRQRVKNMEKVKKQKQLESTYEAVEVERNIVNQTVAAAEVSMTRRDRCCVRKSKDLAIRVKTEAEKDCSKKVESLSSDDLHSKREQVHQYMTRARKNLMSRKIITDNFSKDDLPGGPWRTSPTRDHPAQRRTAGNNVIPLDDDETTGPLPTDIQHQILQHELNANKHVHFDVKKSDDPKPKKTKKRDVGDHVIVKVPDIYPGVKGAEMKKQTVSQRALYRRLFMDIEREQVKELKKKKEHRRKIEKLKKEKEAQRRKVESKALQRIVPRDPVTGETPKQILKREKKEKKEIDNTIKKYNDKAQKEKEMDRFLQALRHSVQEKMAKKNIVPPPLCCCGDSIWDSNPETCANNCVFYRNPRAYAKALQSLLASCEL